MTAIQILIVEDDGQLLQTLLDALRRRLDAAQIDTSDSMQTALDRVAETDYDALVVDLEVAGVNGLNVLEQIQQRQPDTPTLLIAEPVDHGLAVQALRGGAYDFVTKPINGEYFVSSLSRAIECRRLSRDVTTKRLELLRRTEDLEASIQERAFELREALHREQVARVELDDANRRLEELAHRRETFVSTVAHDLATPLSTIQGYAELLGRSPTSPERQQHACAVIAAEAGRLVRLVKDLTDTAQLTVGQFRTVAVACDLAQITREQVELARAFTSRHEIGLHAPAALPITADCDRLAQVLSNLLSNAIKHTPGGVIEVTLQQDGGQALLSVQDSGPGIPRDLAEALFKPGRHLVKRERGRSIGKAGLGLQTVKGIIDAHAGRIWVVTAEGQGSTFRVALPLVGITSSDAPDA